MRHDTILCADEGYNTSNFYQNPQPSFWPEDVEFKSKYCNQSIPLAKARQVVAALVQWKIEHLVRDGTKILACSLIAPHHTLPLMQKLKNKGTCLGGLSRLHAALPPSEGGLDSDMDQEPNDGQAASSRALFRGASTEQGSSEEDSSDESGGDDGAMDATDRFGRTSTMHIFLVQGVF